MDVVHCIQSAGGFSRVLSMSKSGDRSVMAMHYVGNPVLCNTPAAGKVINPAAKAVVSYKALTKSEPRMQGTADALGTGVCVQQDIQAGWESS